MAVAITNADRVIFPSTGHTKGQVVDYYRRMAPRLLAHVGGRPLTLRRFPRGVGAPGFFQKNVPPHYPESMARLTVPRREGETTFPVASEPDHLAFLANQGVIELHVPTVRAKDPHHPDRFVLDLDPPEGALVEVRRAALLVRGVLEGFGLPSLPVATGSKGYHVVAAVRPKVRTEELARAAQQLSTLLAHHAPDLLTDVFRVAGRGGRVFVDWLRNQPMATCVAPGSLRARARPSVAWPLAWEQLDAVAPDGIDLDGAPLEGDDALDALAARPADPRSFVDAVDAAFRDSGLPLPVFDRFRG